MSTYYVPSMGNTEICETWTLVSSCSLSSKVTDVNRNKYLAMCAEQKVECEYSEVYQAGMVKTGFSKDTQCLS